MILLFWNIAEYNVVGLFTKGHLLLASVTVICILLALKLTSPRKKKDIHNMMKWIVIFIWVLEIWKIVYSVNLNSVYAVNTYIPLYYCSILLYAGVLSSFGKNRLKRVGDVVLSAGTFIGGVVFLILPSTSLSFYPAFHLLSIHSFVYHGMMIYLGLLVNMNNYIKLKSGDAKYFVSLIFGMGIVAFVINKHFGSNLMFISANYDVFPIGDIYRLTNGGILFTLIILLSHSILPFYLTYFVRKLWRYILSSRKIMLKKSA